MTHAEQSFIVRRVSTDNETLEEKSVRFLQDADTVRGAMRVANPLDMIVVIHPSYNGQLREFKLFPPAEVGTPATMSVGSDRYAGHIVSVSASGRKIGFAMLGRDDVDCYATLRKDGRYRRVGSDSTSIGIGYATDYRDPSF
jgi:hypothetical protein